MSLLKEDTLINMGFDDNDLDSTEYSKLNTLPSALQKKREESTEESTGLLQTIIEDDIEKLKGQYQDNLSTWSLEIKLALTREHEDESEDVDLEVKCKGRINVLQAAIILNKEKVFDYLIKTVPKETLQGKVELSSSNGKSDLLSEMEKVIIVERWIYQATCAHLAVIYMPSALHSLLTTAPDLKDQPSGQFKNCPLHLAARNGDGLCTRILIEHKAKLGVEDRNGNTPLLYASRNDKLSSLSELLEAGADPFKANGNGKTPLDKAKSYECAQLLLDFMEKDRGKGKEGKMKLIRAALDSSAKRNQLSDATEAILDSAITSIESNSQLCVFDMSLLLTPNARKEEEPSKEMEEMGETIVPPTLTMNNSEMDVHNKMIECEKPQLLLHPLMSMWLHVKWHLQKDTISVTAEMFLNLLHVLVMTALAYWFIDVVSCKEMPLVDDALSGCLQAANGQYMCPMDGHNNTWKVVEEPFHCFKGPKDLWGCMENETHWKKLGNDDEDKNSCFDNKNALESCINDDSYESYEMRCVKNGIRTAEDKTPYPLLPICQALGYSSLWDCWVLNTSIVIVTLTTMMVVFRELIEVLVRGPREYFGEKENLLQFFICLASIGFLCLAPFHHVLGTHVAAWALFAAWLDLTTYLGRFGLIGDHVFLMFKVTIVLLKCFVVFLPTLLGFGMGFAMLLHGNPNFESWVTSCLKVVTMMLGELEFDEHFIYHEVKEIGGRNYSTQIMYLLFALMVAVIIMNLIVALAISATEDLKMDSQIIQVQKRVDDIVTEEKVSDSKVPRIREIVKTIFSCFSKSYEKRPKNVKELLDHKIKKVSKTFTQPKNVPLR